MPTAAEHARAAALLDRELDDDQRRSLKLFNYFHVTAPSGRTYRLTARSGSYNVREVFPGNEGYGLWCLRFARQKVSEFPTECRCERCRELIPLEDLLLVEKLLIEQDENGFRDTAVADR